MNISKATNDRQIDAPDLRQYLREKTRNDHEATEVAFMVHDLTTLTGLTRFLLAHYQANAAIEKSQTNLPWPIDLPSPPSALPSLAASLSELGLSTPPDLPVVNLPEPIGAAYVIAGSRFGNQVLKRRWQANENSSALKAGAYFNEHSLDRHSKTFMMALTGHHPFDIKTITSSASMAFRIFAGAASGYLSQKA